MWKELAATRKQVAGHKIALWPGTLFCLQPSYQGEPRSPALYLMEPPYPPVNSPAYFIFMDSLRENGITPIDSPDNIPLVGDRWEATVPVALNNQKALEFDLKVFTVDSAGALLSEGAMSLNLHYNDVDFVNEHSEDERYTDEIFGIPNGLGSAKIIQKSTEGESMLARIRLENPDQSDEVDEGRVPPELIPKPVKIRYTSVYIMHNQEDVTDAALRFQPRVEVNEDTVFEPADFGRPYELGDDVAQDFDNPIEATVSVRPDKDVLKVAMNAYDVGGGLDFGNDTLGEVSKIFTTIPWGDAPLSGDWVASNENFKSYFTISTASKPKILLNILGKNYTYLADRAGANVDPLRFPYEILHGGKVWIHAGVIWANSVDIRAEFADGTIFTNLLEFDLQNHMFKTPDEGIELPPINSDVKIKILAVNEAGESDENTSFDVKMKLPRLGTPGPT